MGTSDEQWKVKRASFKLIRRHTAGVHTLQVTQTRGSRRGGGSEKAMRVDAPQDSPLSYWEGVGGRVGWRTDLASPSPTGSGRCSSIIRAGRPDTHPAKRLQPSSWCCDRKPHSPNGAATNRAAGTGLLGVDTPSYHTGSEIRPARALMSHRWASLQLQLSSDITQGGTHKCTSGGPAHLILRSSKTRAHRVVPRARRTPAKSDRLRRRRATAQLPRTTLVRTGHASLAYPQDEQYNQAQC